MQVDSGRVKTDITGKLQTLIEWDMARSRYSYVRNSVPDPRTCRTQVHAEGTVDSVAAHLFLVETYRRFLLSRSRRCGPTVTDNHRLHVPRFYSSQFRNSLYEFTYPSLLS